MKLSELKKSEAVTFEDEENGGPAAVVFVRCADSEYFETFERLTNPLLPLHGVDQADKLPLHVFLECDRRATLDSHVTGWRNFQADDGSVLVDRNADGSLHVENGLQLLRVLEITEKITAKINELRAAKKERLEAARGNSEAPSAVN